MAREMILLPKLKYDQLMNNERGEKKQDDELTNNQEETKKDVQENIPQHTISSGVKQEKQSTGESQNNSFIKMKPNDFFQINENETF